MWRTCYFQLRWARVRYMVFFLQPPAVNMFSYPRPESQLNLAWVQFQIEAKDIAGNPSVFRISIVGPARFAARYRDERRERERERETISPFRDDVAAACEDGRLFGTFFSALSVYHCWQHRSYRGRHTTVLSSVCEVGKNSLRVLIDKIESLATFPFIKENLSLHNNNFDNCKVYLLQNFVEFYPDPQDRFGLGSAWTAEEETEPVLCSCSTH